MLSDNTVQARIGETYQWIIIPEQKEPRDTVQFVFLRANGQEPLAARVSKKLKNEDYLISSLGGSILKLHMDRIPLWRTNHVSVAQLVEDFAKYTYLPQVTHARLYLSVDFSLFNKSIRPERFQEYLDWKDFDTFR